MLACVEVQSARRRSVLVPIDPHGVPKRVQHLLHLSELSPVVPSIHDQPNLVRR
jgi:hypothetical protein